MKKMRNIVAALMMLLPLYTFAQKNTFQRKHAFGVTGGVVLSKMTFTPTVIPQDLHMGPSFGVVYRYLEEKYFGIQAELLYTQRGWQDELENRPNYNFSRKLNYIEMPIMSHIYFGNKRVKGFVNLGPQLGVFLNDEIKTNIVTPLPNYENDHHTLDITTRVDYGITGGAGFEVMFGKHAFFIEGRYYFGLNDIFPNEKGNTFETSSNQSIRISASYLFYLK